TFGAGVLFFPISYVFGDVLTEVYGYARARRVVWSGFGALIFASFMSWAVLAFPPSPEWHDQDAFEAVFGGTPRIALASLVAYWAGEFCNSYVLARMKVRSEGRHLWMRTIGSTVAGEGVDSLIFYPPAFPGRWAPPPAGDRRRARWRRQAGGVRALLRPVALHHRARGREGSRRPPAAPGPDPGPRLWDGCGRRGVGRLGGRHAVRGGRGPKRVGAGGSTLHARGPPPVRGHRSPPVGGGATAQAPRGRGGRLHRQRAG